MVKSSFTRMLKCMPKMVSLSFSITIFSALAANWAAAATIILSDFDNSIVETRQSKQGTFKTTFKIFRIEHRSNTLQKAAHGPKIVEISPIDYHRIKNMLGRGNRDFGSINTKVTLESGQVIFPGNYMLVDPDSFENFFSVEGRNFLLDDYKAALARDSEGKWQGEFWDKMQIILNQPDTAKGFGVITARGQSKEDWRGFYEHLKAEKRIDHLPNFNLFHNVSLPEYDRFGSGISEQKIAILKETALLLRRRPLLQTDLRLHPNGKDKIRIHFLIFADDDQNTLKLAENLFRELSQGKQVPVKFGLFNMGTETEVKESLRPRYTIFDSGGAPRRASFHEMVGEPIGLSEQEIKAKLEHPAGCEQELTKK